MALTTLLQAFDGVAATVVPSSIQLVN